MSKYIKSLGDLKSYLDQVDYDIRFGGGLPSYGGWQRHCLPVSRRRCTVNVLVRIAIDENLLYVHRKQIMINNLSVRVNLVFRRYEVRVKREDLGMPYSIWEEGVL